LDQEGRKATFEGAQVKTAITQASKERITDGIASQAPVTGLTHNFYRYPARFSPDFVKATIAELTDEGDTVYDPFMGGGTTLVEASALGRNSIGTDISSLATFISQAKTTVMSDEQLVNVESWLILIAPHLNVWSNVPEPEHWIKTGYQKNISDRATWRIRKLLQIGLNNLDLLDTQAEKRLARCILLRAGQWALDCRSKIPSTTEFRSQLTIFGQEIIDAAHEYTSSVKRYSSKPRAVCLHRSAIGVETEEVFAEMRAPRLVLTSPPYPGLHVLYHRWQVRGRRETAAPFWIAGTLDGDGAAFYTFGDRKAKGLETYFENAIGAFSSVAKVCNRSSLIVQMVAFSEPAWQLPRYLEAMSQAGLREVEMALSSADESGRIWREVPGRKWYANQMGATGGSREVVLFHKIE
jgi:DNA methylase